MLQTLFYIPAEIAGQPVFGFGLLLAVWAVVSVAVLAWLAWRQGFNADTWGYVPILLLIGGLIWWVLPALCEPQGLPIRGYGMMMLLAVVTGTSLAAWRAKRAGLDPDLIFSLAFWMMVPGIIGARAFYVIEYWPTQYWPAYTEPGGGLGPLLIAVVNVSKGGLVVYGSFLGGVAGLLLFVRKHRLPLLALCDLIAPSMLLGLAIGRIGCLLNGCCFGAVCDRAWAVTFPAGTPPYWAQVERGQMYGFTLGGNPKEKPRVLAVDPHSPAGQAGLKVGHRLESINGEHWPATDPNDNPLAKALTRAFQEQQPLHIQVEDGPAFTVRAIAPPNRSLAVHPAQAYSTIDALLLCLLLLAYDPFRRRDGELFALMMSISPVARFLIESLRSDEAAVFGTGLSISQNVSILLLICAAGLWFYILRQPRGTAFVRGARGQGPGARATV